MQHAGQSDLGEALRLGHTQFPNSPQVVAEFRTFGPGGSSVVSASRCCSCEPIRITLGLVDGIQQVDRAE